MHNLFHPGIKATQKFIGERFVWPNMRRDIAKKCRTCISCQQTKITRHQVTPLQHFKTPDAKFSHVPRHPKKQQTYVDPLLFRCSQVFVRIDSVKSSLQRPYSGPHFVLERHDKYFVIEKDGHTDTVTIDRLKLVLVEPISPTGSSVKGETSETLSFSPTSSSEIDNIFAGDLDKLPSNRVYSRRGRLITKPIRYPD